MASCCLRHLHSSIIVTPETKLRPVRCLLYRLHPSCGSPGCLSALDPQHQSSLQMSRPSAHLVWQLIVPQAEHTVMPIWVLGLRGKNFATIRCWPCRGSGGAGEGAGLQAELSQAQGKSFTEWAEAEFRQCSPAACPAPPKPFHASTQFQVTDLTPRIGRTRKAPTYGSEVWV